MDTVVKQHCWYSHRLLKLSAPRSRSRSSRNWAWRMSWCASKRARYACDRGCRCHQKKVELGWRVYL